MQSVERSGSRVLLRWPDEYTPKENSMSDTYQSLSHSRWNCKYHIVFVSKRRRQTMYGSLRKALGSIFHELARQKECRIIEGHLMPDHVHTCSLAQSRPACRTTPRHWLLGPDRSGPAVSLYSPLLSRTTRYTPGAGACGQRRYRGPASA